MGEGSEKCAPVMMSWLPCEQSRIQDFAEGGANSQESWSNLLFCKFFAEYCMEMKEFLLTIYN